MKQRIYLRIGKDGNRYKIDADKTPDYAPFWKMEKNFKTYIPTVLVAVDLTLDDELFNPARILLETTIQNATPIANIRVVNDEVRQNEEN